MDPIARRIINGLQSDFPLCPQPFAVAASRLEMTESQLIDTLTALLQEGFLTRFGPFYNAERMGGGLTLAAMRVPEENFESVAALVNAQPEVAHNYAREHTLNMWFVVATEQKEEVGAVLTRLESLTGCPVFNLPKLEEYRLGFQIHLQGDERVDTRPLPDTSAVAATDTAEPDALDRALIEATQAGLPLVPEPYQYVAEITGVDTETVTRRLELMLQRGWIRRLGAAPNHHRLGLRGNGMSVWNLPDARVSQLGRQIADLDCVTHCYRRPRHLPHWPYNLFVMLHGENRAAVEQKNRQLTELLGSDHQGHMLLHSTRILKKTGLRLRAGNGVAVCFA
ncbi:MAG: hypothetical protein H7837_05850 [Magnetococcus sp. MYC-9]